MGRFTILKPAAFGSATLGRGVELVRTSTIGCGLRRNFRKIAAGGGGLGYRGDPSTRGGGQSCQVLTLLGGSALRSAQRQLIPLPDLDDPDIGDDGDRGSRPTPYPASVGLNCVMTRLLKYASKSYLAILHVRTSGPTFTAKPTPDRLFYLEGRSQQKHLALFL